MSKRSGTVPALVLMAGVAMAIAIIMAEPFPGTGQLRSRKPENVNLTEVYELQSLQSLFAKVKCSGVFDKPLIRRMKRICDDCNNLFRNETVYTLCRLVNTATLPGSLTPRHRAGPFASFASWPQVSKRGV